MAAQPESSLLRPSCLASWRYSAKSLATGVALPLVALRLTPCSRWEHRAHKRTEAENRSAKAVAIHLVVPRKHFVNNNRKNGRSMFGTTDHLAQKKRTLENRANRCLIGICGDDPERELDIVQTFGSLLDHPLGFIRSRAVILLTERVRGVRPTHLWKNC